MESGKRGGEVQETTSGGKRLTSPANHTAAQIGHEKSGQQFCRSRVLIAICIALLLRDGCGLFILCSKHKGS